MTKKQIYDCIIIGGGPAGLTAGIYLARFKCKIKVFDDNDSRALLISKSHNYPGFPQGISGINLLKRLRQQLLNYDVSINPQTVTKVNYTKTKLFSIFTEKSHFYAKTVILATGIKDIEPKLPQLENTIKEGRIRHCLICDGYEAKNKKIGILGEGRKGLNQAILLSRFSKDIMLLNINKKLQLTQQEKINCLKRNIKIINEDIIKVTIPKNKKVTITTTQSKLHFDILYSALGVKLRKQLINHLRIKCHKNKFLKVNSHQETNLTGLFAIGDVVSGLHQMTVATSQATTAALAVFKRVLEG